MARYGMVIDLRKCVGCSACTAACNAEWNVPPGQARTHVRHTAPAGRFPDLVSTPVVTQCNHCDEPSCVGACPSGATAQNDAGLVLIDENLCIGCGFCVEACPYDARFIDAATRKANKCDFCAPRIARGEAPACVATCVAHAKVFGDLEDPASAVHQLVYERNAFRNESAAVAVGPNVFYLGKPEHLELVRARFAPHPPRLLAAGEAWRRVFKPLVLAAVGATFVGQAIAFTHQLRKGEEDFES